MARYLGPFFGANQVFEEIAGALEVTSGDWVFETSIGTGRQVINLVDRGKRAEFFAGLDISLGMLRKCRVNLGSRGIPFGLVQGNAETLPFADESFDMVFHIGGINFFNDKEKAILEMIRVAKPGAWLYVGDETDRLLREQPRIFNFFYQKPDRNVYAPPLDLVPAAMADLRCREFWNGKMYLISFRKPVD